MTSTSQDEAFNRYKSEEPSGPRPYDLWITSGGDTTKFKKLLEKNGYIPSRTHIRSSTTSRPPDTSP
jgi:hypothetical protein